MLVRHVMSEELFSLPLDTPVIDALRQLKARKVRRIPLLDKDERLVGFLTEGDLLKAMPGSVAELNSDGGRAAAAKTIGQVATKSVTTAHPDDHIEDLAQVFLTKKIGGVPVVDHGRVVGMVTESDLFRAMVDSAHLDEMTRITVQRSKAPSTRSVQKVIDFLKLELGGLSEYVARDGREVFVLKLRGERMHDLAPELTRSGWIVLDRREPNTDDSRAAG